MFILQILLINFLCLSACISSRQSNSMKNNKPEENVISKYRVEFKVDKKLNCVEDVLSPPITSTLPTIEATIADSR